MDKNIVVLGGGTGQSVLLRGLKRFPFNITAVVSVSDDGKSSGKIRQELNVPAVGDIRSVLISLSETEDVVEKMINYRFKSNGDLDGHSLGNLLLAGLTDIYGNLSNAVLQISKILNLKGEVLPLTDDNVVLMGKMSDGSVIEGEHNITLSDKKIEKIYYKVNPKVNKSVIKRIKDADAIILSMGSVYTSIIPHLLCKEIIKAIDSSDAKIMYVCNVMTQPGETDGFTASDHINLLNSYLGKRKIDTVITNSKKVSKKTQKIYETLEQKDLVKIDSKNINIEHINKPLIKIENDKIRHDNMKLALEIMNILVK
ncbi:MAG: uridine diphosphate-N-acetylglucosamine-binding protein YvcK [Clostridium sp.]|nr:uridine diphosphate-N-acetylglucosamine-binding protein YvcK [Clostridium sp.]